MPRYVALIRAINGHPSNRIKMVDLAAIVAGAGCADVSWYLQTGNLFLSARGRPEAIATRIERALIERGLQKADVMLRTPAQLAELVARAPFAGVDDETHHCSVTFLRDPPVATPMDKLAKHHVELRYLDDTVACFAVPKSAELSGGMSTVIDRPWGTPTTTRWWRVVAEISARANA